MRSVIIGIIGGIISGGAAILLQIVLTPANMVVLNVPLALGIGVIVGWVIRTTFVSRVAFGGRLLDGLIAGVVAGGGALLGMIIGAIIYLSLPSTHTFYQNNPNPMPGPATGNYIAEGYVMTLSIFSGFVGLVLITGVSLVTLAFPQRRASAAAAQ